MDQKTLSGDITEWDAEYRILRVRFRKWWETPGYAEATVTFMVDPYAIVTSVHRGTVQLTELRVGQRVSLTYVIDPNGHPIAKTLTVAKAPATTKTLTGG